MNRTTSQTIGQTLGMMGNLQRGCVLGAVILTLAACGSSPDAEQASGGALQKIKISYPTRAGQVWPMYIAKEGGYYEKYGLDVELVFGVHPAGIAMISSGEAAMTPYTLEQSMLAGMRDSTMVALGSPYKKSLFALMAPDSVASLQDLKGKSVGVSQIADAPYNYTIGLLATVGMGPRDVEWVPVGTGVQTRAAALVSGRIDATMLTAPNYFTMEHQGYHSLANINDYDEIYAPSVYLFKKSLVESGSDLPERLMKAHAEAIKRFYDDKDFAISAYLLWDPDQTRADMDVVYDAYREKSNYERIPYIPEAAVQYVVDHPSDEQLGAQLRSFDWAQVLDNSLVDRLVAEGFFEELYGPGIVAEQERKSAEAFR